MPAADWLFRQIAAAPSAALTAAVVGAGGTGKTTLLDEVARAYERAGVEYVRTGGSRPAPPGLLGGGNPVLVDDAHQLDPATLDDLRAHATAEDARLVVAYRPWPRSGALSALGATVARSRPAVFVTHLDGPAVAARVAELLDGPAPESLVELVHEQSGGLPVLVDFVTRAMRDAGRVDPRHPGGFKRPDRVVVSATTAERLRHQVDMLEPAVQALLEAMAVGAVLDTEMLAALLDAEPVTLVDTVEEARASGLVTEDGLLIPFIRGLVLRLTPVLRTRELQRRLADVQLERGGSVLEAGRQLLGTGASGRRVAAVFEAAGDEARRSSPALAAELYAGAAEAGAPPRTLAARRAHAAALTGDLDEALRLLDPVVSDPEAPGTDQALSVLAAVLAHRGMSARSAELYRRLPAQAALAVPALVATGDPVTAGEVLDAAAAHLTPSLLVEAQTLMARGMLTSVTGSTTAALSQLTRATTVLEPAGATVLLPDTPAALTALVAMQCGELSAAETTLRRGLTAKLGGEPAWLRGVLLYGWVSLLRGDLDFARRAAERADRGPRRLEPRDELFAAAMTSAVARRRHDAGALRAGWTRARDALIGQPVDLLTLQPLGELTVVAAQLGEAERMSPHLAEADALLARLGAPALWTAPLSWCRLQAAIIAGDPEEAQRHAATLVASAPSGPFAAALAAAAESLLALSAGRVDRDAVEQAARGLQAVGLAWDGARLAGQAAVTTTDRRDAAALQACARALQGEPTPPTGMVSAGASAGSTEAPPADTLP
ncbi:MAG TPA: hypothetical protein VM367_01945, partial [Pseudonocardia sp.]|nr:hypothetical protein [Pseudonocardia sp.]